MFSYVPCSVNNVSSVNYNKPKINIRRPGHNKFPKSIPKSSINIV